ncbi:NAD(P)-dependent dehydrogenase, short-chain alcohol dehydrogenase family [Tistlia consotensis]|uniref:NAD(P)-dependent dehydrogenase, short-chain alcohol dehydrogenase family n=1 Tax=Tistlia consotensis USBA 355 TaxID=560819 RepID=A0A1Y6CQI2_9PROT|nr:SDR family NAD(P)-dependent oxidoreductase [Tistlia consotensis]SMF81351.1 NAD(P)-dependent dehydrogenase, short-chain alcohol dehydrogenase family [Tistlia consotensis USBA 355]SNS22786.1 NAD(P)-dependent dehydrogenase, short-chain alcohol dehydrogenase family [Tistlia consotensis]
MSALATARYADLEGRAVLVTGGASGIGAALVEGFCRQGARTWFVDLQDEAAAALCDRLAAEAGSRPRYRRCDVTDTTALTAVVDELAAAEGGLDVLVNNAANDTRIASGEVTEEQWDWSVAVNLKHQFFASQAAARHMVRAGRGSIVTFGSVAPRLGIRDLAVYSSCKAAVAGLTRTLARELGDAGIRVNAIVPGCIITERQLALWISPEDERRIQAEQCLHRRLVAEDVAQMVLFLASDVSSACSSQLFVVDGGLT